MLSTFRRDKLRRLVEAGKVETVSTYSFDDMHGEARGNKTMPVAIDPGDWRERKAGICYIRPSEFTTKSGCAYVSDPKDGIVTLIVHGNSNYDLRIRA
jgi:hypothetical protein